MALKLFKRSRDNPGKELIREVVCEELFAAAQEYQIRELSFWTCVNMIANALARCEFRTYQGGKEVQEKEYYMWNYSPNANQNSTMFLHKLVAELYRNNEALIVEPPTREDGINTVVVADSWMQPEDRPSKQNEYYGVTVGSYQYRYPIPEKDVIHLQLNNKNMKPVLDGLYQSYYRLISAAMKQFEWVHGQHWKVHVTQIAPNGDDWAQNFQRMIQAQLKPFFDSNSAALPEFDGYKYEQISGDGGGDTRDIRAMVEDIFEFTARAMLIPTVLINGSVEGTADANNRFLTACIDPLCDQLQEEITRKRYGYRRWRRGDYVRVDSSAIIHFDLFANADNVEKIIGTGAFTINDVRRAAGQAPINEPWADQSFMTKNIGATQEITTPVTGGGETNGS